MSLHHDIAGPLLSTVAVKRNSSGPFAYYVPHKPNSIAVVLFLAIWCPFRYYPISIDLFFCPKHHKYLLVHILRSCIYSTIWSFPVSPGTNHIILNPSGVCDQCDHLQAFRSIPKCMRSGSTTSRKAPSVRAINIIILSENLSQFLSVCNSHCMRESLFSFRQMLANSWRIAIVFNTIQTCIIFVCRCACGCRSAITEW